MQESLENTNAQLENALEKVKKDLEKMIADSKQMEEALSNCKTLAHATNQMLATKNEELQKLQNISEALPPQKDSKISDMLTVPDLINGTKAEFGEPPYSKEETETSFNKTNNVEDDNTNTESSDEGDDLVSQEPEPQGGDNDGKLESKNKLEDDDAAVKDKDDDAVSEAKDTKGAKDEEEIDKADSRVARGKNKDDDSVPDASDTEESDKSGKLDMNLADDDTTEDKDSEADGKITKSASRLSREKNKDEDTTAEESTTEGEDNEGDDDNNAAVRGNDSKEENNPVKSYGSENEGKGNDDDIAYAKVNRKNGKQEQDKVNNVATEESGTEVNQNNGKTHPTKLVEGIDEGNGLRSNDAKDTKPKVASSLAEEKSGDTGTKVDDKNGAGKKEDKETWKHDEEKLGKDADIDEGDKVSSAEINDGFSDATGTSKDSKLEVFTTGKEIKETLKNGKESPEDLGKVDDADESDKVSSVLMEKMDGSFTDATETSKDSKLDAFASGNESKEILKNGKGKLEGLDKADDTDEGDKVSSAVKEKKDRFSDATETSKDIKLEAITTGKESKKKKSKSVKESAADLGKVDDTDESDKISTAVKEKKDGSFSDASEISKESKLGGLTAETGDGSSDLTSGIESQNVRVEMEEEKKDNDAENIKEKWVKEDTSAERANEEATGGASKALARNEQQEHPEARKINSLSAGKGAESGKKNGMKSDKRAAASGDEIGADANMKGKSSHASSKVAGGKSNDRKRDADTVDTDFRGVKA
jgi:hypothetical protein